jgi:DnaJ-class molecular chaperone
MTHYNHSVPFGRYVGKNEDTVCTSCDGDGGAELDEECDSCDGRGVVEDDDGDKVPFGGCNGTGTVSVWYDCWDCNGSD